MFPWLAICSIVLSAQSNISLFLNRLGRSRQVSSLRNFYRIMA